MDRYEPLAAGYRLLACESLDSTNERARRLAREGAPDGVVVWARRQTAGRGRQGRQWHSPEGNLYCSIVLRPDMPAAAAAQFTFVAALALGDAVSGVIPHGVDLRYKWPNDILLDERKAAGILLESSGIAAGCLDWLVVGTGLNMEAYPQIEGQYPATSLRALGAGPLDVKDMLERYVDGFAHWRMKWQNEGLPAIRDAWLRRAARLGERITVRLPQEELSGRFEGLDESGALLLREDSGRGRTISAGDVFF